MTMRFSRVTMESKPKLAVVNVIEVDQMERDCLCCPSLFQADNGVWWADADELRAWRLQHTSGVPHGS